VGPAVAQPPAEPPYPFARFNKKINIVRYNPEDYVGFIDPGLDAPVIPGIPKDLPSADGNIVTGSVTTKAWTREETDELFRLCSEFDLRFVVIHDRWPETLPPRSIDELKDRYYGVAKTLVETRTKKGSKPHHGAFQKHCEALVSNPFDIEYEIRRKSQFEEQYSKSKFELLKDEMIVRRARDIEAERRRQLKERERIKKLVNPSGEIRTPLSLPFEPVRRAASRQLAGGRDGHSAIELPPVSGKSFPHRKHQIGPTVRSNWVYTPVTQSTRVSKKLETVLEELHVPLRPTVLGARVVDEYDALRMEIMSCMELQRTVTKKEEENIALRAKLARLRGEAPPGPRGGALTKKRKADEAITWEED